MSTLHVPISHTRVLFCLKTVWAQKGLPKSAPKGLPKQASERPVRQAFKGLQMMMIDDD